MGLRILNWNILHTLESSRLRKFSYCNPESLLTKHRLPTIVDIIKGYSPDIACFQELDPLISPRLTEGLHGMLKEGIVHLNSSLPAKDGCGIYFNPHKLDVVDTSHVRLGDVLDKHLPTLGDYATKTTSSISLTRALHREIREKLNMAVFARFSDKTNGNHVTVCSSHLFWDPAYPDIKLIQAYLLAKECAERSSIDTTPIIVGADLSSVPTTIGVYELLMGSGKVSTTQDHHPVQFRSKNQKLEGVLPEAVPDLHTPIVFKSGMREWLNGTEPPFTNYTENFKGCLDYILLYGNVNVVGGVALPDQTELSIETALPNSRIPSDHLPLVLDIESSF